MTETSGVETAPNDSSGPGNKVLSKMLDRLMAVLVNGPSLNCRPHNSRQRVDFAQFKKLGDLAPEAALEKLLGDARKVTVKARVPQPKRRPAKDDAGDASGTEAESAASAAETAVEKAWADQNALLNKLHTVAEDARTYEQDTGVHVLNVGFPLLSLPPGSAAGAAGSGATRRILAPIAFIPVTLTVKRGSPRAIELACRGEGVDLIIPNAALLSWIEQQTGKAAALNDGAERAETGEAANGKAAEPFSDEAGEDPWREIRELTRFVCSAMEIEVPEFFAERVPLEEAPSPPSPDAAAIAPSSLGNSHGPESGAVDSFKRLTPSPGTPGEGGGEGESFATAAENPSPYPSPGVPGEGTRGKPTGFVGNEKGAAGEGKALELALSPAPRADESGDGPAVLCTAILGLFPMANQGLLRDTQAMVAEGPPPGPVRSFVRVGMSLDTSAARAVPASEAGLEDPAAPAERRRRDFAGERLVADADPCQSRAVRLARESAGLVVHGPPGTGKSQTITNIIGDHLARGQRVLLVCEKRTALDVVANRLRHMGMGGLIAIVHDPRRDQRELYRTLRQQLDDLSGAQIDEGAAGRLNKVDADLQKLHDELTKYHAALTRIEIEEPSPEASSRRAARTSFQDLVGQWLDTMAAAEAGPRPQLNPQTAEKVAAFGLADLDERLHDIEEILHRAEAVGWAANPWREAATADLASFLTRSADAHRTAVRGCVDSARATDVTIVPAMPAFVPEIDLQRQADARVALADKLRSLLESAAPEALARWSTRPFTAARAARTALTEAGPYVEVFRAGPLDADLMAAASRAALPAPAIIATQVAALQKYADAYSAWSSRLEGIIQKAPGVPQGIIARWVLAEAPAAELARNRLDTAAPLAKRCASAPLDAELLPVFRRQPFDLPQLLRWQSALEMYLQIASTWHAVFHFSKRREAMPVAQFFGLPLLAAAGTQLRDFLAAVRLRLEVREALDAALRRKSGLDLEDDKSLLGGFADHHAAVTATAELDRRLVPASGRAAGGLTGMVDLVNGLVPVEHAAAAPILAAHGLPADAASASRLRTFLRGLSARLVLQDLHWRVFVREGQAAAGQPPASGGATRPTLMADAELDESLRTHTALLDLIVHVHTDPLLGGAPSKSPLPSPPPEYRGREKKEASTETPPDPRIFPALGTPGEGREGVLENDAHHEEKLDDPLLAAFTSALADPAAGRALVDALRRSPARVAAILSLESTLSATRMFDPTWLNLFDLDLRDNQPAAPTLDDLARRVDTLESVVRVRAGVTRLPEPLQAATTSLMQQSTDSQTGTAILRHAALEGEIAARLAASPVLQEIDGQRIEANFERYHKLIERKQQLVRDAILAQWVGKQKERLLSGTGSRLNALGAELRRRLTLRGERAMRLRRVIEVGRRTPGGDPLLDLCPIWMVSPETVAQVFPREPIFDAVVFDEASQCRLEEALPVLTRGSRVVIAGDPQQLPPSRFFESAVTLSEDEDPQTDQELFETQQAEVEDLLGAALGLDIRHCYLDVHYRSRSDELIAFSNEHFYHNRLQSIPRHPSRRPSFAPVTLYRAGGVYDKRRNEAEADRVCQIVQELLLVGKTEEPPSIGIACFNLPQRDLIVERLDELASGDPAFAKKLDEAHKRTGAGSFEGLFVKNLENVQGDERDHIIISTTYGPDKTGRFYRRFGPVGLAGGGRRLNVLITRARDRVHLVTSIPTEAYRHLPPPQPGQTPGGGWLLFAYLRYAEGIEAAAQRTSREDEAPVSSSRVDPGQEAVAPSEEDQTATRIVEERPVAKAQAADQGIADPAGSDGAVRIGQTRARSVFAEAIGRRLAADRNIRSYVYWGNDGFCVDLLLHDPSGGELPPKAAILCDAARYPGAEDAMEWDIFRSAVLADQGWQLHRLWSPHVFRDPAGAIAALSQLVPGDGNRAGKCIENEGPSR